MIRTEHHPPEPGQLQRDSAKNGTSYRRDWFFGILTTTLAPGRSTNVVRFLVDAELRTTDVGGEHGRGRAGQDAGGEQRADHQGDSLHAVLHGSFLFLDM